MGTIFIILFLLIIIYMLIGFIFSEEIKESKNELEKLKNIYVEFVKIEGNKAFFISHELKKMYYIKLDIYDLYNSEMKSSYLIDYVPEGWGRHKILHNNKVYKLYEI